MIQYIIKIYLVWHLQLIIFHISREQQNILTILAKAQLTCYVTAP